MSVTQLISWPFCDLDFQNKIISRTLVYECRLYQVWRYLGDSSGLGAVHKYPDLAVTLTYQRLIISRNLVYEGMIIDDDWVINLACRLFRNFVPLLSIWPLTLTFKYLNFQDFVMACRVFTFSLTLTFQDLIILLNLVY